MQCPKCNSIIADEETVCPHCHKVLLLECPNCHALNETATCEQCGYSILVKCSKCSQLNPTTNEVCSKCKFPIKTSIAYQECESDEIASVSIKFNNLNKIRRLLKSKDLYNKFFNKLYNLLLAQIKNSGGKFIKYDYAFIVNMNKELSFPTSANKAVRFSLKLINAMTDLNAKIQNELAINLGLEITITKKKAENLLDIQDYKNNVKPLIIKKENKRYLKGFKLIIDQYVWDEINKEYKTDSLYSLDTEGTALTFYEILLESYVLPPNEKTNDESYNAKKININKNPIIQEKVNTNNFKVFDISAKCTFDSTNAVSIKNKLSSIDFKQCKILTIKSEKDYRADIADIIDIFEKQEYKVLNISCTEKTEYSPWGFFETVFRQYYNLPIGIYTNSFKDIDKNNLSVFQQLFDFCSGKYINSLTSEDARFAYMELWSKFLSILNKTVIIVDNFEYLDDTSLQTLSLYFDNFNKIKPNFVFIVDERTAVHTKFKKLLQTKIYTELTLTTSSLESCISTIKSNASDFINSFYFEKLTENFAGSYLYFKNAISYLKETGVLLDFEDKLIIKDSKSVILAPTLQELIKLRIKNLSKNSAVSFIFGYAFLISTEIHISTLEQLEITDLQKCIELLAANQFIKINNDIISFYNYPLLEEAVKLLMKPEAETFLVKNIFSKIGKICNETLLATMFDKLQTYKEEYLTLWKNSNKAMATGDYDSYLKNCFKFLSLIELTGANLSKEVIEENKKEIYNSILLNLYDYAPSKIYHIENILLLDALNENNNEKILKLSNLMLQGALINSNYTDALRLLHNILTRIKNPTLIVDNKVNSKFLLLSFVHIEILYNLGHYRECAEIADEILEVINPEIIEQIRPESFSVSMFIDHITDTMRTVALAKLLLLDSNLEEFTERVCNIIGTDIPDKDCILAIKDTLADKTYLTKDLENCPAYSKVVYLILQEFAQHKNDLKTFAGNIYHAKLLANDIHQKDLEYFADLLIGYAYGKANLVQKSKTIFLDIINRAEETSMFNILMIGYYFMAKSALEASEYEEAQTYINDALAIISRLDNQAKLFYALFEKLYIDFIKICESDSAEIETEELKLQPYKDSLKVLIS
ncbi:MAG: zinc ribbon domain-containing protein [bacterium]|nr:zinc ribbon domain-containing protein [bacterium]